MELPQYERGAPDGEDHGPFDNAGSPRSSHREDCGRSGAATHLETPSGAVGDSAHRSPDPADDASNGRAAEGSDR
ncbi:hypothetical protein [Rhodococcus xishaensis]|uniref:hypothetical protein n=1 Tax=Rhodococcus xishaensis TaxID=2487364 RepID=UPI0019D436BC|nr:hypothetical protein [Rhodococcus xishaensis]